MILPPHSNLYVEINKVFPIYKNLDVQFTHQFYYQRNLYGPSQKIGDLREILIPINYKYLEPLTGDL
jgi:hypothetical protein